MDNRDMLIAIITKIMVSSHLKLRSVVSDNKNDNYFKICEYVYSEYSWHSSYHLKISHAKTEQRWQHNWLKQVFEELYHGRMAWGVQGVVT